jgi:hypothetical protein
LLLHQLRLPRHCDEGKQDGNDVFLVHIHFVLLFDVLDVETARL